MDMKDTIIVRPVFTEEDLDETTQAYEMFLNRFYIPLKSAKVNGQPLSDKAKKILKLVDKIAEDIGEFMDYIYMGDDEE